ncbi:MAG: hypothetical protein IIB37_07995 [Gemmatimonadetes bacterium]|nr:hypothetical protein [Gemmatimonadota bacterium]
MNTALRRLLLFGIVMVATGCDNVEWGGIDFELRSPSEGPVSDQPPAEVELVEVELVEDTISDVPPLGPMLYLGYRDGDGDQATLVPVAEIGPEGLFPIEGIGSVETSRAFAARHFTPGLEFTLFSDGAQVGSFIAEGFSVDDRYCRVRPQILGQIELTPAATAVQKFLAVPAREASELGYGTYSPVAHTTELRNTSLRMAGRVLRDVGVFLPGVVIDIRRDIRIFRARPGATPTVVATFVYADDLAVGPAPREAYSIFLAADDHDGLGYSRTYVDYRLGSRDGKGAARYFDHLDIDGDGTDEIVLEVMGERSMWLSTLSRQGADWVEDYRDPCGLASMSSGPAR